MCLTSVEINCKRIKSINVITLLLLCVMWGEHFQEAMSLQCSSTEGLVAEGKCMGGNSRR